MHRAITGENLSLDDDGEILLSCYCCCRNPFLVPPFRPSFSSFSAGAKSQPRNQVSCPQLSSASLSYSSKRPFYHDVSDRRGVETGIDMHEAESVQSPIVKLAGLLIAHQGVACRKPSKLSLSTVTVQVISAGTRLASQRAPHPCEYSTMTGRVWCATEGPYRTVLCTYSQTHQRCRPGPF